MRKKSESLTGLKKQVLKSNLTVCTSRELGLVEMKYRFCSSGHGINVFSKIVSIPQTSQKAALHPSFDVKKRDEHN
jgi:hypothetical protein